MSGFEGKSALVTGSTRGVGLALARALLNAGASVFITARTQDDVTRTVETLGGEHPGRVFGAACDVRDHQSVKLMFGEAGRSLGLLHILVNNAGVGLRGNLEDFAVDDWNAVIETNLSGVFYCCREALPMLRAAGGGFIINIGSLAGVNAFAGATAYCASKFGLIGFTEALMQEVRFDGIRVSTVMPGSVNTTFNGRELQDAGSTWKLLPEDIADAIMCLLEMDPRAMPSRLEVRPSQPRKK